MSETKVLNTAINKPHTGDGPSAVSIEDVQDLVSDHTAGQQVTVSTQDKAFAKKASKALRGSRKSGKGTGARKVENILRKALNHFNAAEYRDSLTLTLKATELDSESAIGYHLMAVSLDKLGEKHKALLMFEKTLELDPSQFEVYHNLGAVARDLNMPDVAEKFLRIFIDLKPNAPEGYNDLGALIRDQNRFDDAIEILRLGINLMPDVPLLWNTMGTVAAESDRLEEAEIFYNEALRLSPGFNRARYNLANHRLNHGDYVNALSGYEDFLKEALPGHMDTIEARYARSTALLGLGRIEEGWREYQVRNDPLFRNSTLYATPAPLWQGEDVRGKNILVIGEQGVGDEIMFANPIRDLIEQVGEDGNVLINVTERLVPLFERTYPECLVGTPMFTTHNGKTVSVTTWENDRGPLDFYTPMGDLCTYLRPSIETYRNVGSFLTPDPQEVERWKEQLSTFSRGLNVGLCWRSGVVTGGRGKFFAPLKEWGPVFDNMNASFVNLQYGEVADEVEEIQSRFGRTLHQMEGLDLKDDLDSNAALCEALDVVIAAPTAAAALSGAVGTKTWFIITKRGWPSLGEQDYPFYADTEVFDQEVVGEWTGTFKNLGAAIEKLTTEK